MRTRRSMSFNFKIEWKTSYTWLYTFVVNLNFGCILWHNTKIDLMTTASGLLNNSPVNTYTCLNCPQSLDCTIIRLLDLEVLAILLNNNSFCKANKTNHLNWQEEGENILSTWKSTITTTTTKKTSWVAWMWSFGKLQYLSRFNLM